MPDESALDDAYAALGVASTASELEITRAYLQLRRFAGDPSTDADAASIERAYAVVRTARGIPDPRENVTEQISVFADASRAHGRRAGHDDRVRPGEEDRPADGPPAEDARAEGAAGRPGEHASPGAGGTADADRDADRSGAGLPFDPDGAWSIDDDSDATTTRAYGDELAFLRGEAPPTPATAAHPWLPAGPRDGGPSPWAAAGTAPDDATAPISWGGPGRERADPAEDAEARTARIDEDALDTAPIADPGRRAAPAGLPGASAFERLDDPSRAASDARDDDTVAWTAPLASADRTAGPSGTGEAASTSSGESAATASPSASERARDLAARAAEGAAARGRGLAASALAALDARRRARRGEWTLGLATGPLRSSWTEADDLAADRRRLVWAAALALAMIAAWLPIGLTALRTIVDVVQAPGFEPWTVQTGVAVGEGLFAILLALAARSIAAARGRVRGGAVLMMLVSAGLVALAVWQSTLVALSLAPVALFALAFVARSRRRAWNAYEEERRGAELWERLVDGAAGGGRRLHWVIQAIPRYAGRQSEALIETQGTSTRETILLWGAHAPGRWIDIDRSSGSVMAWATDACRTSWDALESRARRARERRERG